MSAPAAGQTPEPSSPFTKIFVAVHGIGDQMRNSTVRSVATRFARSIAYARGSSILPLAPQPLGYFHGELGSVTAIDDPASGKFEKIGFSEIFWADLPKSVQLKEDTLEETKAWARTLVARARNRFEEAQQRHRLALLPAEIAALKTKVVAAEGKEKVALLEELDGLSQEKAALEAMKRQPVANADAALALVQPDFSLAGEVLDEVIETVYVLENLTFLAEKAGLFSFDLRQVLEDYVGDVQLVTEFAQHRHEIIQRFHEALTEIQKKHSRAEIHIVAHSEGTVVSFLGLLLAMAGVTIAKDAGDKSKVTLTKAAAPAWLGSIRGYMTLGSPIDKHLLLWPRLWEKVRLTDGREVKLEFGATGVGKHAIAWRNYYDYGDPVGFKLDTARDWLGAKGIDAFAFCDCERCQHDIGFARYLLPGKAHNDYWDDADVFDHFIRDVVEPETAEPLPANTAWKRFLKTAAEALRFGHPEPRADRPFRPKTNAVVYVLSPLLPYVLSLALLTFGVFILYKAVVGYTHPGLDPVQKFVWYETVGKLPKEAVSGGQLLWHAVAIALLTAGVTLLARLPRLALGARWWFFGALAFLGGAAAYVYGVDGPSRADIGGIYYKLPEPWRAAGSRLFEASLTDWIGPRLDPPGPTLAVLGLALTVALFGLYQALRVRKKDLKAAHGKPRRKKESAPKPRRQRWFFRGMRPLILAGGIAVVLITAQRLNDRGGWTPPGVTLTGEVARVVAVEPAVWPVVLGGAAFLYLWWLAALIFDLGFVWARYVRSAKAIGSLREWSGIPAPDPRKCRLAEEKKVAATS